jgi:hypothetical protein
MDEARYKHLANFMRQRGQKIPGVPLISLWQFIGVLAFGFAGYSLQLPAMAIVALGLVALICFTVYQGEFAGRRLLAIAMVYSLALANRRRLVTFEPGWEQLADHDRDQPAPATILLAGESGTTVLS